MCVQKGLMPYEPRVALFEEEKLKRKRMLQLNYFTTETISLVFSSTDYYILRMVHIEYEYLY